MKVIYEDNHITIVNKQAGEIVQGDKTGDRTLADDVKAYIKEKYAKPGDVFLGVVHRLDRPVSGVVVFARTSKALSRLNDMFRTGKIQKTYQAIVPATEKSVATPDGEWVTVDTWLTRNERQNKAFSHQREVAGSKRAVLDYRIIGRGDRYNLLEVRLHTGRHHQIRCQLSSLGMPIKGDLKYGSLRSNPDGSISLHARHIAFEHPVSHQAIDVTADYPDNKLWMALGGGNK